MQKHSLNNESFRMYHQVQEPKSRPLAVLTPVLKNSCKRSKFNVADHNRDEYQFFEPLKARHSGKHSEQPSKDSSIENTPVHNHSFNQTAIATPKQPFYTAKHIKKKVIDSFLEKSHHSYLNDSSIATAQSTKNRNSIGIKFNVEKPAARRFKPSSKEQHTEGKREKQRSRAHNVNTTSEGESPLKDISNVDHAGRY